MITTLPDALAHLAANAPKNLRLTKYQYQLIKAILHAPKPLYLLKRMVNANNPPDVAMHLRRKGWDILTIRDDKGGIYQLNTPREIAEHALTEFERAGK
jgi:hypothetical protein